MKKIELFTYRKQLHVKFVFPYNRDNEDDVKLKDRIKKIPKCKFDFEFFYWKCPIELVNIEYIDILTQYYKFERPAEFDKMVIDYKKKIQENTELSNSLESSFQVRMDNVKKNPYPFQVAGVHYLINNKRSLLGDEQGLGKTLQSILVMNHLELYPALVVCPNTLKYNWFNEITQSIEIDSTRISIINGDKKDRWDNDITIINYDKLNKFEKTLASRNFKLIIFDESQKLKSSKSNRSASALNIAKGAEYVFALSGTVVDNQPVNIVNQLNVIGRLKQFGGAGYFKTRYCNPQEGWGGSLIYNGGTNLDELHRKLREICYLRRNKETVLTELPDKTYSQIYIDLTLDKEYKQLSASLLKINLAQLRNKWDEFATLRKMIGEHKLIHAINWIETFMETEEKLVVFAHHRSVVEGLAEHFHCHMIYGGTTPEDRIKYVNDFQTNPNTKLIILNIASGSVGLTLTAASNLLFVELPIIPGDAMQAEDRIHRIGQKNVANIYYLIARNTIDDHLYGMLMEKMTAAKKINAGIEFSEEDIMNEVFYRLQKKNDTKILH